MAFAKINFSRASLIGLPFAPEGKRNYYVDSKEPGLLLCITSSGTKSFQVYLKKNNRPVRVTLGHFSPSLTDSMELPNNCNHNEFISNTPELNVRMARTLATLVRVDLRAGINASDIKRAKREELTLGELFEEYMSRHLIPQGKKRLNDYRENYERYLGEMPNTPRKKHGKKRVKASGSVNWHRRTLSSISKRDVLIFLGNLSNQNGKHTANLTLSLLRAMFNKAKEWGFFEKDNPAVGIPKFKVNSRERFLRADELPCFFRAVAEEPSQDVRDYVLLSLLTGARRGNVLSMRWADISFLRAEWHIKETKNGDPQIVPLVPQAVEILKKRKPKDKAEFVFPSRGKLGYLREARMGWRRILDRAELNQLALLIREAGEDFDWPITKVKGANDHSRILETLKEGLVRARELAANMKIDTNGSRLNNLRIHDLRRTLGSWQAATGASLVVIGKSLGHKDLASTQIYSRLDLDPVRQSMQTATSAMLAAGGLIPKADVVTLKKKTA